MHGKFPIDQATIIPTADKKPKTITPTTIKKKVMKNMTIFFFFFYTTQKTRTIRKNINKIIEIKVKGFLL